MSENAKMNITVPDVGTSFARHPRRCSQRQHGFSLLEVLIALLVLAIGLLGLATLQTVGLKFNQESYLRSQAVLIAYDIIDRIRSNPVAKSAETYA